MSQFTTEEVRILRAVAEGRMGVNQHGRYVIEGEKRPDRKAREALQSRGLLLWPHYKTHKSRLTHAGETAVRSLESATA